MRKIKVSVQLFTGENFFGAMWVEDKKRAQDMMNDDRKFLPFDKSHGDRGRNNEDIITTIVINKDAIAYIEER